PRAPPHRHRVTARLRDRVCTPVSSWWGCTVGDQLVEALGRNPAIQPAVDHDRGRTGAISQTVDRLEREAPVGAGLMKAEAQRTPGVRGQGRGAHRLAGLGLAQAHSVGTRPRAAKIVIKGNYAVHL